MIYSVLRLLILFGKFPWYGFKFTVCNLFVKMWGRGGCGAVYGAIRSETSLVHILAVAANIEMINLKTKVGKGST